MRLIEDVVERVTREIPDPTEATDAQRRAALDRAIKATGADTNPRVSVLRLLKNNALMTALWGISTFGAGLLTAYVTSPLDPIFQGVFTCSSTVIVSTFFDPAIAPVKVICQARLKQFAIRMGLFRESPDYLQLQAQFDELQIEMSSLALQHANFLRPFLRKSGKAARSQKFEKAVHYYTEAVRISLDTLGGHFLGHQLTVSEAQLYLEDFLGPETLERRLAIAAEVEKRILAIPPEQIRLDIPQERMQQLTRAAMRKWLALD